MNTTTTPPTSTTKAAAAMLLIEKFGRAVTDMFEQMEKGNWRDDHDHDVRMNRQMQALIPLVEEAIALRAAQEICQ